MKYSNLRRTDGRTDGRTDILLANAALHYVARPKCTNKSDAFAKTLLKHFTKQWQ